MKKKGFTLIELLAVIIILAVIALIATPTILDVIEDTKASANRSSIYGIVASAENYYAESMLDDSKKEVLDGVTNVIDKISLNNAPDNGVVYINEEGKVALAIVYNNTCYTKYFDTGLYESKDIENCGTNNEFTIASTYVNFGGEYLDEFVDVINTSDGGYLAIGNTNSKNYNGLTGHGEDINYDAIIVKFNSKGEIEWSNNFGGSGHDYFTSVIEENDSYIVLGYSNSNDEDLAETIGESVFIIKYDNNGQQISKKILLEELKEVSTTSIKKNNDNYYILIKGRNILSGYCLSYVIKYDSEFNQVWVNQYNDRYSSSSQDLIINDNGNLVISISAMKKGGEVEDIYIEGTTIFGALFELSAEDGKILGKVSLGGNNVTDIRSIIELEDSYVVVGNSTSKDGYFTDKNNGDSDGYIAKIGKTPTNGLFPLIWINHFGGSAQDVFSDITILNDEIIVLGYSKSSDYDMQGVSISDSGYTNAIIVKYDLNGNVIKAKSFGGSNTDRFNKIILSNENYVVAGTSFSTNKDMMAFNYGNGDAVIMQIDNNLNLVEEFKIKPLLMTAVAPLIKNYGTSIPTVADKQNTHIYTTINPSVELKNWCSTTNVFDPNGNYDYVRCLKPFNDSDVKTLYYDRILLSNIVTINANSNDWIKLFISYGNAGLDCEITDFKIKFSNKDFMTIQEAVNLGYVEPLVLIGKNDSGNYFFENTYNLITEGNSGSGPYPAMFIMLKPKNIKLEQITFNSSKELNIVQGNIYVYQYHNFDMSLTKSE